MNKYLDAELWDKMHYLFRDYNDRMVHVQLDYDYDIDVEALKTVIICFFEKTPVLHSSFTDNHIKPFWTVNRYTVDDVLTVKNINADQLSDETDMFLTQYIPPENGIQMKVAVFKYDGKSTLCIVENHMCMDGGDFKYFLKALCLNYNEFITNGTSPLQIKQGSRAYSAIYSGFSQTDYKAAQSLYKNINKKDNHRFPLTERSENDKSFIVRREVEENVFLKLKNKGKLLGATINDMMVAAYFYSLYELAGYADNESVSISCAIDLRRHIKDSERTGITNHTAWMQCRIPEKGNTIFDTVKYVTRSSNEFKRDKYMGLHGLPLLSLGYKILPHAASEEIIKIGYSNPLLAISNIGILESDKLALNGNKPVSGFMSGAVKYKPYALLSLTTINNRITLSMCVKGNNRDKEIVNEFFDLMEKNIGILVS